MAHLRGVPVVRRFASLRGVGGSPWRRAFIAATALIAVYHQWLGQQTSNPYFGGDAYETVGRAASIAANAPPGIIGAWQTKSPGTTLLYAPALWLTRVFGEADTLVPTGAVRSTPVLVAYLAALATLLCVLTGLVAWRYAGSRACGLVALLLAGLYPSFVILSERGLTEIPFAIFLLLTFLCLHIALNRRSAIMGALAGGSLALAALMRTEYALPLYALAFLLLAATFAVLALPAIRAARDPAMRAHASPVAPLARVFGALLTVLLASGVIGVAISRQIPEQERLGGIPEDIIVRQSPFAYVLSDGWARDTSSGIVAAEQPSLLERNDRAITSREVPECRVVDGPYLTLSCLIIQSPGFAVQRLTINELRLWWYPHNDFHLALGAVTALMPLYHRFLVCAGVIGCLALVASRRIAWLLLLPALFVGALFAIEHVEVRYAVPAIPAVIVGAAYAMVRLAAYIAARRTVIVARRGLTHRWGLVWGALAGSASLVLLSGGWFFAAYGATRGVVLITRVVPFLILAVVGLALLRRAYHTRWAVQATGVVLVVLLLVVAVIPAVSETTDGWSVTLTEARQQLIQRITLPGVPDGSDNPAILLDLQATDGDLTDLVVTLNDHPVTSGGGRQQPITLTQQAVPAHYQWEFNMSHGARDLSRLPQWVVLPVPAGWLYMGENTVTVSLRADRGAPRAIRLFGQYGRGEPGELALPGVLGTSFWKDAFDGDPRVVAPFSLQSVSRDARYSPDSGASFTADLSPAWGAQRGTYHIFIGTLRSTPGTPGVRVPVSASIPAGTDESAANYSVEMLWFIATAPSGVGVSLLDDDGEIVSFLAGQGEEQIWHGARADLAYVPAYRHGISPAPLDPHAGAWFAAAPTDAVARYWATMENLPQPVVAQESYSGAYVLRFHQPTTQRSFQFAVTAAQPDAKGVPLARTWETLIPPRGTEPTAQTVYTNVLIGNRAYESAGSATLPDTRADPPAYWLMHSGSIDRDVAVTRAAAALGIRTPKVRLSPIASTIGVRHDPLPQGTLDSLWAYADLTPRGSATLTLA